MLRPWLMLAVTATAVSAGADAQSKSALSWVREPGTETCIGTVELAQRVERLVGPMLVSASDGQVSVEGKIARTSHGFVADLTIADAHGVVLGTRQLKSEPEDCRAIDDQLAFVVAVAIDPNAALAELPAELSQDDDPGAALLAELRAQPQPTSPSTSTTTSTTRAGPTTKRTATGKTAVRAVARPVQLRFALEPALGLGNLPAPAAGGVIGVGVAIGDLAFWLRGSGWLAQEQTARSPTRVRVSTFGLALAVCPLGLRAGAREQWSAWLCPGLAADAINGKPVRFDGTTQHRWVFGPDLELRAGLEVSAAWWLGVSAQVQSRWPHKQLVYEVDGAAHAVYRTPLAGARLAAVLELRF